MTISAGTATNLIAEAVGRLNDERPAEEKITFASDMVLLGSESQLDSVSLVALLIDLGFAITDACGVEIDFMSDQAFSMERSPFYSVVTLSEYVVEMSAK